MTEKGKKILLSGVKPSGRPHVGNYFGAMRRFVDLQNDYETFIMIADLHALTTTTDAAALRANTLDLAIDYLAIGLDPAKVTIFKQSDVPEHTELAWIFDCLVTMPYLMRAHAFKDAEARSKDVTVGTFNYPMLMAADILLYDPDVVPVGQDQKQHLEITRDIADKFNRVFGETFKIPEPLITTAVKVVPGLDGQKMSKSYGNIIPLFATEKEIHRLVMSIVTDSKDVAEPKNPEDCQIFTLHKLFSGADLPELKRRYITGGIGYRESKEILIANINKFLAPLRDRRANIDDDTAGIIQILKNGAATAHARAKLKMERVRRLVGIDL